MKDKYLRSIIERLNKGYTRERIIQRPLSKAVDYALVWIDKPKITNEIMQYKSYPFYFIKNEDGIYVALVSDMGNDLHWFVLPEFRKRGHLTSALKTIILPHIFLNKEEQRITINVNAIGKAHFKSSESVALNVGFEKTKSDYISEYLITSDKIEFHGGFNEVCQSLDETKIELMRKQLSCISHALLIMRDEAELLIGDDNLAEDLHMYGTELLYKAICLEDLIYKRKTAN